MNNYYDILEISPNSSFKEIKMAYRKLAKQFHPDRNHSPTASAKFQQIGNAFDELYKLKKQENADSLSNDEELLETLFTPLENPFQNEINFFFSQLPSFFNDFSLFSSPTHISSLSNSDTSDHPCKLNKQQDLATLSNSNLSELTIQQIPFIEENFK